MAFKIISLVLCFVLATNYFFAKKLKLNAPFLCATRALATLSVFCVLIISTFFTEIKSDSICYALVSIGIAFAVVADIFDEFVCNTTFDESLNLSHTIVNLFKIIATIFVCFAFVLLNLEIGKIYIFILIALIVSCAVFNLYAFFIKKKLKLENFSHDIISRAFLIATLSFMAVYLLEVSLFDVRNLIVLGACLLIVSAFFVKYSKIKESKIDVVLYYLSFITGLVYFII